jgi:DNA repair exonuclease SbcCD ATPase subunit
MNDDVQRLRELQQELEGLRVELANTRGLVEGVRQQTGAKSAAEVRRELKEEQERVRELRARYNDLMEEYRAKYTDPRAPGPR